MRDPLADVIVRARAAVRGKGDAVGYAYDVPRVRGLGGRPNVGGEDAAESENA